MNDLDLLVGEAKAAVTRLEKYLRSHSLNPKGPEGCPPETFWVHDAPDGLGWQGRFASKEEAEREGRGCCTGAFYVRQVRLAKAREFFPDAVSICDIAREYAHDNENLVDEDVCDFACVGGEAAEELNALMAEWADRHFGSPLCVFVGGGTLVASSRRSDEQLDLFAAAAGRANE